MKNAQMSLPHFRFALFNFKTSGEIVTLKNFKQNSANLGIEHGVLNLVDWHNANHFHKLLNEGWHHTRI